MGRPARPVFHRTGRRLPVVVRPRPTVRDGRPHRLNSESKGIPKPAATSYPDLLESARQYQPTKRSSRSPLPQAPRRRTGMGGVDEQLRRALVTSVEALASRPALSGPRCIQPARPHRAATSRPLPASTLSVEKPRPAEDVSSNASLVRAGTAGPLALETDWRHLRVDGAFHRTWWVGTGPASPCHRHGWNRSSGGGVADR